MFCDSRSRYRGHPRTSVVYCPTILEEQADTQTLTETHHVNMSLTERRPMSIVSDVHPDSLEASREPQLVHLEWTSSLFNSI